MPNREQDRWEGEDDAVIEQLASALREPVPVRAEWRNRVLDEIEALPHPQPAGHSRGHSWTHRRLVMSPLAGLAAAVLCIAIGVTGALLFVRPDAARIATNDSSVPGTPAVADVRPAASGGSSSGGTSVRFVIVAVNASRVSLVGDFNGWDPTAMPMQRAENGIWVRDVELEPGRHVYAFYVDGALQVDPSAPRAAEDDFGIPSSALIVRNAGSD